MGVLSNIEPKNVFHYFEEISKIPHGSRNTKQISDYLKKFADDRGLLCYQDEANNIIIVKEATAGYEQSEPVILQGHMDMVCEKTPESNIDFEKDGLDIFIDGDFVKAKGTTLGGDNGIAIAMGLALLDGDSYNHPRIEMVATVDEEIGLIGADLIDVSKLTGKRFINIDSEEEGIFTVSCAGGVTLENRLPVKRKSAEGVIAEIKVDGLLGGHSGIEIDKERANANVLLGRTLDVLREKLNFKLASVAGGSKDNAITKLSTANILLENEDDAELLKSSIQEISKMLAHEYRATDPDIKVQVEVSIKKTADVFDEVSTANIIDYLLLSPFGVQNMSKEIEGLVETSLNLGILKTEGDVVFAVYALRSSIDSRRDMLVRKLKVMAANIGGKTKLYGEYPGWEYMADSKLREKAMKVFEDKYGKEPNIEAIHAGLECGLFAGKIEGLDCISIGPDLFDVHTPDEKLSISSTERVFDFLITLLEELK